MKKYQDLTKGYKNNYLILVLTLKTEAV